MLKTALRAAAMSTLLLAAVPALAADDPVVAKVDGHAIHRSDVVKLHDQIAEQNPQLSSIPMEQVMPQLIDRLVDEQLLTKAADAAGTAKKPEVKEEIAQLRKQAIQNAYLRGEVESRVTDAKLRKVYKEKIASAPTQEEVHARHILVKTEAEAKAIIKKLDKGADFAELAKKESTGPSGPKGGDLGYFKKGDMVPAFADAAFKLKKGQYTETPVKTQFGWHVIKVEDRRKAEPPKFKDVRQQLYSQMAKKEVSEVIASLRKKAKVEIMKPKDSGSKAAPAGAAK